MKRFIKAAAAAVLAVFLLAGCPQKTVTDEVSELLGIDLSRAELLVSADTHSGPFGDGLTVASYRFTDDSFLKEIEGKSYWKPLPLSENISLAMYGGRVGQVTYRPITDRDENLLLPEIQNGYYYFVDRQNMPGEMCDDSQFLGPDRCSLNFYLGVYDADTGTLYYVKFDT